MIYLIAGHSTSDPGAVSNGLREADLTLELRNLIAFELEELGVKELELDDHSQSLSKLVNYLTAKSEEDDLIFDIHFNAAHSQATGVETIIPLRPTEKEKRLATKISRTTAQTLGIRDRGAKTEAMTARGRLAIMSPKGTNILLETCFITNKSDMDKYASNKKVLAKELALILNENM